MKDSKKRTSAGETILWMILTAAAVFVVTSIQYNRLALGGEEYDYTYYSGDNFKKLNKIMSIIESDFLFEYDMEKVEEGAINGMLKALEDPYTNYFNKSDAKEFLTDTEGEYEGVGIYISIDVSKNCPVVIKPIKGSPAEEAGVKPGDYIVEIDGKDVTSTSLEETAAYIKGKVGSEVKIKFIRYANDTDYEEIEKTLIRRKVEINAFEYELKDGDIAYIKFESFDEKATDNFINAYNKMARETGIKGLIIDVRDNTGGLLTAAQDIIDSILPTGIITYTVDKNGNKEYIYSDSRCINIPIVVIANGNSASAAEITAAAIKDYDRGAVVGETTYGKGLVQEFKSLRDGTYVKVTISEYFSPSGNKINEVGVEPNYIIEDNEETEVDEQLQKALEVIRQL